MFSRLTNRGPLQLAYVHGIRVDIADALPHPTESVAAALGFRAASAGVCFRRVAQRETMLVEDRYRGAQYSRRSEYGKRCIGGCHGRRAGGELPGKGRCTSW